MRRRKHLEIFLQRLQTYRSPRLELEQYATTPELAASILCAINEEVVLDDKEQQGKLVADLGCGCGVLMLGAAQIGDHFSLGIDIDDGALKVCRENISQFFGAGACAADILQADVRTLTAQHPRLQGVFDLVLSNPPFGTKNNAGIDWSFVQAGVSMLRPGGSLYSLHKSASRRVLLRKAERTWPDDRLEVECVAELRWDLGKTYKHQKMASLDIEVDLLCFRRGE